MTPEKICDDVKRLIEKLGCKEDPIYIECAPEKGAKINDCFSIVEKRVSSHGGSSVFGWQIWKEKFLVEAEFHAVWRTTDDKLVDISPKADPQRRILFAIDDDAIYEGKQVDNVRLNIIGNRLVDDLIEVSEAMFRLLNRGDRAQQHKLTLPNDEARACQFLQDVRPKLEMMLKDSLNHQSRCFCDSRKKYKVCCGKQIRNLTKRIKSGSRGSFSPGPHTT